MYDGPISSYSWAWLYDRAQALIGYGTPGADRLERLCRRPDPAALREWAAADWAATAAADCPRHCGGSCLECREYAGAVTSALRELAAALE